MKPKTNENVSSTLFIFGQIANDQQMHTINVQQISLRTGIMFN